MSGASAGADRTMILAFDGATTRVVVALGTVDGDLVETRDWPAGYRHGETLLPAVAALFDARRIDRRSLAAIVVGTGPGAFTGLRVGIATAKGLAHALGVPIIGLSTAEALLADSPTEAVLLLPAGPSDRLLARRGTPARLLPAGTDPELASAEVLVAIDLAGRAPDDALERGETARAGLGASLIALGAARLAADDTDDVALLVPDYVTLPRGVRGEGGEVSWSHDRG
ncbi:MAG: tRNA (adenosine(37)-N6)-threonylcarbamoyltransferase complex dimerization subunit type 1 TsaB [Chloroflexota bacterium]